MKGTWVKLGLAATGTALVSLAGIVDSAEAATMFSTGSSSAVTTVDRSANFDSIFSGQSLLNYQEGNLRIDRYNEAFVNFDPFGREFNTGFYYGTGGLPSLSIRTADGSLLRGLEFLLGSGSGNNIPTIMSWRTLRGGIATEGVEILQSINTVFGWKNDVGFDELTISLFANTGQPLSPVLDNLKVELFQSPNPTPIPTPALLPGLVGMGLAAMRKRKQAEAQPEM